MKTAKALLLAFLIIPGTVNSQGLKSSIRQCSREVYDLIEGEYQYIEECKTTYVRRYESWSRRIVDRIVKEECQSKAKVPEIIIEYPEDWP